MTLLLPKINQQQFDYNRNKFIQFLIYFEIYIYIYFWETGLLHTLLDIVQTATDVNCISFEAMRIAIDHSERHRHQNIDIEVHTKQTIGEIILFLLCIVKNINYSKK